jgi:sulfotransferase family protein
LNPVARRIREARFRNQLLRPLLVSLRYRHLRTHDALIASYPRSGSTWLRFMLYESLSGAPSEFRRVDTAIPNIALGRDAAPLLEHGGRLFGTHEVQCDRDRPVVYVVRDPRSVVLSEFAYDLRREVFFGDFETFLAAFLKGRANPFGDWGRHVRFWLESEPSRAGHLHLVKFEDLRKDPGSVLHGVLAFLGAEVDPAAAAAAVANNTVEHMREKEDRAEWVGVRTDIRFVNSGSVSGWQERLRPEQIEAIEHAMGGAMARVGYPLVSPGVPS